MTISTLPVQTAIESSLSPAPSIEKQARFPLPPASLSSGLGQTASTRSSAELNSAGARLHVSDSGGARPVEIASSTNHSVAGDTAKASMTWKGFFARVAGVVCGLGRGFLTALWSPVTALKYLVAAIVQACKGEWEKAGKALSLALTAPVWTACDGFMKTYERFAAWGDGLREFKAPKPAEEKNWLEYQKDDAKSGVIDKNVQKALNDISCLPLWLLMALLRANGPGIGDISA